MSRTLTGIAVVALLALPACVRAYKPPNPDEPHAVVKLRRVYPKPKGPYLREDLRVADYQVQAETEDALEGPRTDAVRVRPGPQSWTMEALYFHNEQQMVRESYTEQEPYTDNESYQCGSSSYGSSYSSPRYCNRTVTKYRSITKYRNVMRTVEVSDGYCKAQGRFVHREAFSYLLQYRFSDDQVCHLTCVEQLPKPDGSFDSQPCPIAPNSDE